MAERVKIWDTRTMGMPDKFNWFTLQGLPQVKTKFPMALSIMQEPETIENKFSVAIPQDIAIEMLMQQDYQEEKIFPEIHQEINAEHSLIHKQKTEQQSMLVVRLRQTVMMFEEMLDMYLQPNIPIGLKQQRKYLQERTLFIDFGYKEIIKTIDLKVEALCRFEHLFSMDMFDGGMKDAFKNNIKKALEGDFHCAQEVVNSVMQIAVEEMIAMPNRKLMTKIRG